MTTIQTYPSPLIQNKPGILTYSNPSVLAKAYNSYVLKNVLGTTVSNPFVFTPTLPLGGSIFYTNTIGTIVNYMAFDNFNNLYLPEQNNGIIKKITPSGIFDPTFVVNPALVNNIYGVAFNSVGNLYVTSSGGTRITKIEPNGNSSLFVSLPGLAYSLAFDKFDNLYIVNNLGFIDKIDPLGNITLYANNTSGLINSPQGIVLDSVGNLYIANYGNNNILKVDTTNNLASNVSVFATSALFNRPFGITIDSAGNFYVSNIGVGNNTVSKIDPTGLIIVTYVTGINQPSAVAFNSIGDLFVYSAGLSYVYKITTTTNTFTFSNVVINTSGLNHLFIYDNTIGQLVAFDIFLEIGAICFKEGTKILCFIDKQEKYIPIEDIKEDTFVKIYKKNGKFEDQYKRAKTIIKGSILNAREHTMHKLYKLSKSKNPALIADLYVTGSHALLYDNLSNEEFEKMDELIECYNNYNITFSDEDEYDEEYINDVKNLIKYYNDYKITLEDKYKLIAYFNMDFEEVIDNSICNIYHIVLENANKTENYGIYANGILAESTCEVSLTRFPGYEKINKSTTVNNGIKKGFDINDKLNSYLIKKEKTHKNTTKQLIEHIEKIEDIVVKQIDANTNKNIRKSYTYKNFIIKKNVTCKNRL
jgi:DNA-binding beta-propeller fold protein YncE